MAEAAGNETGGATATAEQPITPPYAAGQAPQPEQGGGSQSASADWLKSAQGGGSAPKPQAESTAPGTAPQLAEQPVQTVGVPVTSLKRGGLLGVIDSMADVMAGKTRPELGKDPEGNLYVKQHNLTRGEQWMRIAGEAVHGAAAGLAAGRGAGNGGKAALAGWDAGQQDRDREKQNAGEMDAQVRQQTLDNANNQMLRMKMAEETWKASRLQVEAGEHDVTFAQGQEDRLTKSGATLLGVTAHPGDIDGITKANPDLMKDLVHNHALEFIPNFQDGKPAGFKVYKTQQGYRDTLLPAGAEFPTFNSVNGQYDWHKSSDPQTQGQIDDYWTAAGTAAMKFKNEQAEQKNKSAQTANLQSETNARDKELPGKMAETAAKTAETRANTAKVPSEIAKNWAETHAAEAKATDEALANGQGPEGEALVDMIGSGRMPVGRLSYLMARKPELLAAVSKKFPDFDGSKIDSYLKAYQDFTSGKTSVQLNAGGTALMHLARLEKLNTISSHNPLSPDYTAYMNQATTVATELAKFYGDATIPAIAHIRDSLTAQLPGKRDRAIGTQAQSMSKKMDEYKQQWDNAAPSAAYEAQMPRLAPEAEEARAHFDPQYREQRVKEFGKQPAAAAAQPVQLQPGEVPLVNPQTQQQIVPRNGVWVDVKTGQPVK